MSGVLKGSNGSEDDFGENLEGVISQEDTFKYLSVQELKMGPEGLEPSTNEL